MQLVPGELMTLVEESLDNTLHRCYQKFQTDSALLFLKLWSK